jgi:hypothetical protein
MKRAFLITIDTEGDRMWSRPAQIETTNAGYLPRFQQLCERFGYKPTYLTNYEMAESAEFQAFGRDVIARGTGEVGMHLHAWNSPPIEPLTDRDMHHQPYLIEYPPAVLEAKVEFMTDLLERRFDAKMTSHRAGRWAMNPHYVRTLLKHGYKVDCSVTPTVSWRRLPGDPKQQGGTDYTGYPSQAYFVDPQDLSRVGTSSLLELPMTIRYVVPAPAMLRDSALGRLPGMRSVLQRRRWLRPHGDNLAQMLKLVEACAKDGSPYVEFMLHSSEFMPGCSPTFPDVASIEKLYADMEQLFEASSKHFKGETLTGYHDGVLRGDYPALRADRAA